MSLLYRSILICFIVLTLSIDGRCELVITPPDLLPGEQYRLVFVTQGTRDATSTNIDEYNDFVTAQANSNPQLSALGTSWRAIVSTATVNARVNTNTQVPFVDSPQFPSYRLDGVRIASNYVQLWSGNLQEALVVDQTGTINDDVDRVWTGTQKFGETILNTELGTAAPIYGLAPTQEEEWLRNGFAINTSSYSLYAISGLLTATSVPEPKSLLLTSLLIGVVFASRLFPIDKKRFRSLDR